MVSSMKRDERKVLKEHSNTVYLDQERSVSINEMNYHTFVTALWSFGFVCLMVAFLIETYWFLKP